MGGYGSGRRSRSASKTDEFHQLDLKSFKPVWFENGRAGTLTWSRGGHKTGAISYECGHDFLKLSYSVGPEGNRHTIEESFRLSFSSQPFGGVRRWILCKCGKRCRVLLGGQYFRCRICHGATYESQYERFRIPGMVQCETVRQKLGIQSGFAYGFGPKPKGMHWKTYRRYQTNDLAVSIAIDRALMDRLGL